MSLRVIDPRDNVAVQIGEGGAVPSGHKVARRAIAQGSSSSSTGKSSAGPPRTSPRGVGAHPQPPLPPGRGRRVSLPVPACLPAAPRGELWGYPRPWGDVGIRNEIYILPTVGCVNPICQRLAQEAQPLVGGSLDGIFALPHQFGCSQLGEDGEKHPKAAVAPSPLNPQRLLLCCLWGWAARTTPWRASGKPSPPSSGTTWLPQLPGGGGRAGPRGWKP